MRSAIRHDDDHRLGLFIGNEVVENDLRMAAAAPFVLVAANAVEQIKDWIPIIGGITGRPIDERFALVTDGFRVVLDHFEFAVCDAFALFVESFRRIWERRLVVGLQLNRPAKSAPTALGTLPTLARCGRSLSAVAFGRGLGRTKITDLAIELDLVARNPARVCDSEFVVLNLQWLDESHRVAFDLAFLQLGFAFFAVAFNVGFARDARAILLERECVFLQTALCVELGFPGAGDIRCQGGE